MQSIKCVLCKSENFIKKYSLDDFNVVKCSNCGNVSLDFKDKAVKVNEFYSADYYLDREEYYLKNSIVDPVSGSENSNIKDLKAGLQLIESYKPSGKLLDIGCALGIFLSVAKERGWGVFGIDVSEFGIKFAKEKLGIDGFVGNIKDCKLPDKHFDVITLWDVIEHFEDPLEELKEIRRVLVDDGIILFDTPNLESLMRVVAHGIYVASGGMIKYPVKKLYHQFHLHYFSPATLTFLLEKAGFEIIEMKRKTIPITKARGNRLEKIIVSGLTQLEKRLHREFEILVIARKAGIS